MAFLRFLESIRFPALNGFMSAVTYFGDEAVFMAVALIFFWCVSKRQGYYILIAGLLGVAVSQILKLLCRVPRPWVLDPAFTIVESARAGADGYSFPSGHTQSIVGTMGAIFAVRKETWLRIVCIALIILVPFSRMYLGVHTPLDVGVGFAISLVLVAALYPCFRSEQAFTRSAKGVIIAGLLAGVAYAVFVLCYPFPADMDADNLAHGIQNGYTALGCVVGLAVIFAADRKHPFKTEAPLPGQILKLALGFALLLGIKSGLKALFLAVGLTSPALNAVRYFCVVVFGGAVWPRTFPYFAKLGAKAHR